MSAKLDRLLQRLDRFAEQHGTCCAGCDHWAPHNSVVGACTRTAPVQGSHRGSMLGITGTSAPVPAGHILTPREHFCGEYAADGTNP